MGLLDFFKIFDNVGDKLTDAGVKASDWASDTSAETEQIKNMTPKDGYDQKKKWLDEDEEMSTERKIEEMGKVEDKYQDELDRSTNRQIEIKKSRASTFLKVAGGISALAIAGVTAAVQIAGALSDSDDDSSKQLENKKSGKQLNSGGKDDIPEVKPIDIDDSDDDSDDDL